MSNSRRHFNRVLKEMREWVTNYLEKSFQDGRNSKENDLKQELAGHLGEECRVQRGGQ